MKIKEIEIRNFKALASTYKINLTNSCKNLLTYGENGSGKSSLCQALQKFFSASQIDTDIAQFKNIFIKPAKNTEPFIKLSFSDGATHRPTVVRLNTGNKRISHQFIADANKRKAFLDYRQLMKIHLIDLEDVNLFNLLVENLLYFSINPVTSKPIGASWESIKSTKIDKRTKAYDQLLKDLDDFSAGLTQLLIELEKEANEIIDEFKYNVRIHFRFRILTVTDDRKIGGQKIKLDIDFYDKKDIPQHHQFLNEARLTAIAIAIYLGSILNIPSALEYKILVLDDIFIGLDTSNRMPLLEILKSKFSDYQIIMTTYDRQWYELARLYTDDKDWVYSEMYIQEEPVNGYEFPIYCDQTDFLTKAENHLNEGDLKSSALNISRFTYDSIGII